MSETPRVLLGLSDGDSPVIYLRSPYHPAFVEALKKIEPVSDRQWEPVSQVWIVAAQHHARLMKLLFRYWDLVQVAEEPGTEGYLIDKDGRKLQQETLF